MSYKFFLLAFYLLFLRTEKIRGQEPHLLCPSVYSAPCFKSLMLLIFRHNSAKKRYFVFQSEARKTHLADNQFLLYGKVRERRTTHMTPTTEKAQPLHTGWKHHRCNWEGGTGLGLFLACYWRTRSYYLYLLQIVFKREGLLKIVLFLS